MENYEDTAILAENMAGGIPMEIDLTLADLALAGPPEVQEEVDEDEEEEEDNGGTVTESCGTKAGRYAKMILPHIGLVLLLGVYTLCGAGIFHVIELPHEEEVRSKALKNIKATKDDIIEILWNFTDQLDLSGSDWKFEAEMQIQRLEKVLYDAYKDDYVNWDDILTNKNGSSLRQMWTIPQAIFFSTTVITTIGYGNLVPQTTSGRIFCIVFGLFGIPLLLITIADIGKFLSDLMKYLYRTYRNCKRQLNKQRKRLYALGRKGDAQAQLLAAKEKLSEKDMRLPWIMVMLVLITYTALGALIFHMFEGWDYFEAFYFCFITMATVGFGDIVPAQQVYMFFTIAYILIGLALTTMCIDLAGTEYIAKIHYFGQKIDSAKGMVGGAVVSGLHAGELLLKNTSYGFIRTTGGKMVQVKVRNKGDQLDLSALAAIPDGMSESEYLEMRSKGLAPYPNILFSPISPDVERLLKPHIKIRPEDLKETDAFILENKTFNRPLDKPVKRAVRRGQKTKEEIKQRLRSKTWPKKLTADNILIIAPFLFKESDV